MIRSIRAGFGGSVAGAVLLLAASAPVPRAASADPLLDLPFSAFSDCSWFCRPCRTGEAAPYHDIVVAVGRNARSSHLENCNLGSCAAHDCDVDHVPVSRLEEIWFDVREASGERLLELLDTHREVAWYNADRDAVQIRGCEGTVLASIPLTPRQVAVLE